MQRETLLTLQMQGRKENNFIKGYISNFTNAGKESESVCRGRYFLLYQCREGK